MSFQLVQTVTVGSGGAASIEFTGIPQDGTDLLCVISSRRSDSSTGGFISQVNGSSTPITTNRRLYGSGSTVTSDSPTNPANWSTTGTGETSNTFGNTQFYIPNYTSAVAKAISTDFVSENNATTAYQGIQAGNLNITSAITSLTIAGTFAQHSTASLYKITKA